MAMIMATIIDIVAIMCFSALAIHFDHWWISLFALLFMMKATYTKEDDEDSSTEEHNDNI